jgi:hypothetical protein
MALPALSLPALSLMVAMAVVATVVLGHRDLACGGRQQQGQGRRRDRRFHL